MEEYIDALTDEQVDEAVCAVAYEEREALTKMCGEKGQYDRGDLKVLMRNERLRGIIIGNTTENESPCPTDNPFKPQTEGNALYLAAATPPISPKREDSAV